MPFNTLGLSPEILRAVSEKGYSKTTPIQRQAIPAVLKRRDVMAGAQTGTGKTAAFTLPLLQRLSEQPKGGKRRFIRSLILTPTRELADQVHESVRNYGRYLPLKSTVVFGGVNINRQIQKLRRGVDVLVATPGRLLDHVGQNTIDLSKVEILVLDEADRMLDMGFIPDVRRIISLLPEQRQNLLFFATFSKEVKKLAHGLLKSPTVLEVAQPNTAAASIKQVMHPVDLTKKRELLSFLIGSKNWKQVLVFTRTKHGANRLSKQLESDGLRATAIHGDKTQGARAKALEQFKKGIVRVLVATDVASRGLDINKLPHVVNFELPEVPEDYVHRIGRTGRAGKDGEATSLVCVDELKLLKDIERLLKTNVSRVVVPGYEPDPSIKPEAIRKRRAAGGGSGRKFSFASKSEDKYRGKRSRPNKARSNDNDKKHTFSKARKSRGRGRNKV